MNEFKIGDVVKLKSGSPPMTIKATLDNNNVECTWFEDKHGIQKDVFHQDMLRIYSPTPLGTRIELM